MVDNRLPNKQTTYQEKKAYFDKLLTVYGRNTVLEAFQSGVDIRCLHLADSNKPAAILKQIEAMARQRDIPVKRHEKRQLSRISKNSKQDQGIAADIFCPLYQSVDSYFADTSETENPCFIALDNINNPQNLGMIIRSICAGELTGLSLPKQGGVQVSPLVIKASAGHRI